MLLFFDSDTNSSAITFSDKSHLIVRPIVPVVIGTHYLLSLHSLSLKNVNTDSNTVYVCCSLVKSSVFNDTVKAIIAALPVQDRSLVTLTKRQGIDLPVRPGCHSIFAIWLEDAQGQEVTCDAISIGLQIIEIEKL